MYISILIIGIFKYTKLVLTQLKGEIGSTIIVGGFNNPLSTMTKFPRTKKNSAKKSYEKHYRPNDPNRHMENIPYKSIRILTFLMCTQHNVRVSQILGHKTSLSKFKKTEIIPRIFFF